MLTRGWIGLAIAAVLPATATLAADTPPPRTWGNVPTVPLRTPQTGAGWGPGGWQAGQPAAPAAMPAPATRPAPRTGAAQPGYPPAGRPSAAIADGYGHGGDRAHGGDYGRGEDRGHGAEYGGGFGGGLQRGSRVSAAFLAPGYIIGDWGLYGLPAPGYGADWIRYYDGAALVDGGGIVRDYRDAVDWDRGAGGTSRNGYAPGFDDGYRTGWYDGVDYAEDAVTYRGAWKHGSGGGYGYAGHGGAPYGYSYGYGASGYGAGGYGSGGASVYTAPGGATVVVVNGGSTVTTTTTEETVSYAAPQRVWHRPVRRWHPSPCCCRCR